MFTNISNSRRPCTKFHPILVANNMGRLFQRWIVSFSTKKNNNKRIANFDGDMSCGLNFKRKLMGE